MLGVLRPQGIMAIADFGPPVSGFAKFISGLLSKLERTSDNLLGLLPVFAEEAGFTDVLSLGHFDTIFGTIWILRGKKPGAQV